MGLFSWDEHKLPTKKSGNVEGDVCYMCPPGARPFYSVAISSFAMSKGRKFKRFNFRGDDLDDLVKVVEACRRSIECHKKRLANEKL